MGERRKKLAVMLPVAAAIIVLLAISCSHLTAGKGAPSYSPGDRWTWQVTRQELDPLTDNITSTRTYEQTIECTGDETRNGYRGSTFRLTVSGQPLRYGRIFRVREGKEVRELLSESFENDAKIGEYLYSAPMLVRRFPLRVGLRFSDAKAVTGYDNATGIQSIEGFETRVTEVVARETLMMPAAVETYRLRSWGAFTGTMTTASARSRIIVTYEETIWYSESVKEAVGSISETTTVAVTPLATSVTKTREERVLSSYSAK